MRAWILVFLLSATSGAAAPSGASEDKPVHEEKLKYDPETGRWVAQQRPVPGTPEGDLRIAQGNFADGKNRKALGQVRDWIETYGAGHRLYPSAALLQAEIEIARRNYYKAHKLLQAFLSEYAGTEYTNRAIELEFVIAEVFLSGTKRKWLGLRLLDAEDTAIEILDEIANNYPNTPLAEQAVKTKADYYYRNGDYMLAELEYAQLVKDFPNSRYLRYAMLRSAEAALASFNGIKFDDAPLIEAEERYRDYLASFPQTADQEGVGLVLDRIHSQRAAKELDIARYYERAGHPRAAAFYYQSTIKNWPDTIAAVEAERRLAELDPEAVPQPVGTAEPAVTEEDVSPPTYREESP